MQIEEFEYAGLVSDFDVEECLHCLILFKFVYKEIFLSGLIKEMEKEQT
jgi:hypothetical protein